MILSDRDIRRALEEGRIRIDPMPDLETSAGLGFGRFPAGHDLHGLRAQPPQLHRPAPAAIDRRGDAHDRGRRDEPFIMQPGDFALASTIEILELPDDLLGRLEGRSSIARLGITVHSTAAVFEPGWIGTATMELSNLGRMAVALYPGHADLRVFLRGSELAGVGALPAEAGQQVRRADDAACQSARRREPDACRARSGLSSAGDGDRFAALFGWELARAVSDDRRRFSPGRLGVSRETPRCRGWRASPG